MHFAENLHVPTEGVQHAVWRKAVVGKRHETAFVRQQMKTSPMRLLARMRLDRAMQRLKEVKEEYKDASRQDEQDGRFSTLGFSSAWQPKRNAPR